MRSLRAQKAYEFQILLSEKHIAFSFLEYKTPL